MNYWTQSKKNIFVAAHRGWSEKYPENTMPAFRAALELNVDQIEVDVRETLDGELVLIHDPTVDRTTNGTGKVREMTFAQLRELDAGSYKGDAFVGTKIPTLREFMELVKDHPTITLDIELKEYPSSREAKPHAFEVCDRVLAMLDEYNFADRVVINTFSNPLNEYVHKNYGDRFRQHVYYPLCIMHGAITMDPYSYAYCSCMFRSLYCPVDIATNEEFERMEAMGPQPWAGAGVKDEEGVALAIERGATLITCNNPDRILEILRALGYHA